MTIRADDMDTKSQLCQQYQHQDKIGTSPSSSSKAKQELKTVVTQRKHNGTKTSGPRQALVRLIYVLVNHRFHVT